MECSGGELFEKSLKVKGMRWMSLCYIYLYNSLKYLSDIKLDSIQIVQNIRHGIKDSPVNSISFVINMIYFVPFIKIQGARIMNNTIYKYLILFLIIKICFIKL